MSSLAAWANNPSSETIALKKSASFGQVMKILLAEDNSLDQEITGKMLRKLGHDVDTLKMVQRQFSQPDV